MSQAKVAAMKLERDIALRELEELKEEMRQLKQGLADISSLVGWCPFNVEGFEKVNSARVWIDSVLVKEYPNV